MSTVAAGILFLVVLAYAIFAGADFGAGFWDLTAGGAVRGRAPRALIDKSIGPVWEANHVWLIFALVVAWTAFPTAFAAVMRTLYVPLGLAALGIVLRGSGFAFRKVSVRTAAQRANGATFAASSVVTPFFFGTVAGAVASGQVHVLAPGESAGPLHAWVTPASMFTGALAVVTCAYLAAIFLTAEARSRGDAGLEQYFRRRSFVMAAAAGAVAVVGLAVVHVHATHVFRGLLGRGLPLVILSLVAGLGVLLLLSRADPRVVRILAALAVAALVAGWGIAQYPYLLGDHLSISAAAAPPVTLDTVLGIFIAAVALIAPSLAFLYLLHQKGRLEGG